jgi:fatty-acyl-CoA synthase
MRFATHPETSAYQQGLDRNQANYAPLSPLSFLERTADVYPDRLAVVHGSWQADYKTLRERSRRLASALAQRGVKPGDTVAAMLPNTPPMLEAHHGVPMAAGEFKEGDTVKVEVDDDELSFTQGQPLASDATFEQRTVH